MLPVFVGLVFWVIVITVAMGVLILLVRRLRPYFGFIFLTPILGFAGAFLGFMAVGWFFDKRLRPETATSLAFYLGFLFCGFAGSIIGLLVGFAFWKRFRH